jgi:hypothetical protein
MFALVENNTVVLYPYGVSELSRDNPNTSFGKNLIDDELLSFGLQRVFFSTRPDVTWSQIAEESTPVFSVANQRWEQSWVIRDLTSDELQSKNDESSNNIRTQRNLKLAESDWTQGKDIPDSISTPWATYRQALRDITQQSSFPQTVSWPEVPL